MAVAVSADDGPQLDAWGSTRDAVRSFETKPPVLEGPGRLVHHANYGGIPVTVSRRFREGRLWQVRNFNRSSHASPAAFVEDYKRWRARLIERYGDPDTDVREWRRTVLREQSDMEGMALAGGKLFFVAGWKTDETLILMTLQRDHMGIAHQLILTDPDAH